ncbi:hypothetical protein HJG53_11335 [Sphingomonas sp. ID1715]|uniref:hypothetical protein n=1 Tax=Sphingomonas sp. ID1715 TaxID=1656898 RepID=UPI0014892547|nr:hypothetical protein [Sphingomonas sp. ID1715]NNM77500.1 hypothetical protein [Sphingomonas sp. ID1715]
MRWALSIAAGAALAACTPSADDLNANNQAAAAAPAKDGTDYVAQVRGMTPKLRQATFLRAIRDAQQACQQVVAEQPVDDAEGDPAWTAVCEDGRGWLIAIAPNGNAKVTGPVPAKAPAPTR